MPWISRGLEGLWLLTVLLVPLVFFDKDYVISEAEIANVEVPKVALLRLLAGLMALLWLAEWAITSRAFEGGFSYFSIDALGGKLNPINVANGLNRWLKVHPIRWFLLAAGLFFGSTFLSTVLSGSFETSLWGEIPGQDGYSAYTIASYSILFGVIATHLRTRKQLGRLLGAVVLMGTLVSLYGVLQHYGHDFLGTSETTGGVNTIFMGNRIFAGAVLSMTVPVTLVAAAAFLQDEDLANWGPLLKLEQWQRDSVFTFLWALVLAIQFLGLMFTFSRGPWCGSVLAIVAFLGLAVVVLGWQMLLRIGLLLGLAGVLALALLQWQGNVTIIDVGDWFGPVLALAGLAGTFAILFFVQKFSRSIVFLATAGAVVAIVGALVFAPAALSGRGVSDDSETQSSSTQVGQRITSIKTDVLGGFFGGRGTHWKVSWKLITERPWFEFDDLSLSWLRPVIGYGPDLFRYTYLLESPAEEISFRPLEPDHAHNFFIHQSVEQGIIGGFASLAIFVSVFGVIAHHLLRRRISGNPLYRLLVIGLMAVLLGRFLEMMVGVARISDLTVLWVIFALFAAMIGFDDTVEEEPAPPPPRVTTPDPTSRRARRRAARASVASSIGIGLFVRLAVFAWVIGGIGVVTWQKSINSVRASVAEGRAIEHFRNGDFESSLKELDKAIDLAPGVPPYYNNRAQVFLAYQLDPDRIAEPICANQSELPYLTCLGLQSLESNLESINRQPFYYRAQIAAGNAAFNLNAHETAVQRYTDASSLVPSSWVVRNDLAESLIILGLYDDALLKLEQSIQITGEADNSISALNFKAQAFQLLGRLDEAAGTLSNAISISPNQASLNLLRNVNLELGINTDVDYFSGLIDQNPNDAAALYFRGLAHMVRGNFESATIDIEASYDLGLRGNEVRANRAYARFLFGVTEEGRHEFPAVSENEPLNALYYAYNGDYQLSVERYFQALDLLEIANVLEPDLGIAHMLRGKVFMALGLEETAKDVFADSSGLELPTAQHYADRGINHAYFNQYESAFSDLGKAIAINPGKASYYDNRAKIFANLGDFDSAITDLTTAVGIDPTTAGYFVSRGVINHLLGNPIESEADFETARSLGEIDVPSKDRRNISYFNYFEPFRFIEKGGQGLTTWTDVMPAEATARRRLKEPIVGSAYAIFDFYSTIQPDDKRYENALKTLASQFLELEFWTRAVETLSTSITLSPNSLEMLRARGGAYLALNRLEDAFNDFNRAVALDPTDSASFTARGRGLAQAREYDLAMADLNQAIALDPTSSDAFALRGFLSVQQGELLMAFADIDHALELSPLNHDAYAKRAAAHLGVGRTALALDDLNHALIFAPTNTAYLHARGLLHSELEEYELAIADFDSSIAMKIGAEYVDPKDAATFLERGRTHAQLGNLEQAIDDASGAITMLENRFNTSEWDLAKPMINIQLADAHQFLGDVYAGTGEEAEAQEEYRLSAGLR